MTLKDHTDIIENSVMLEIKDGDNVLYHGWRGNLEHAENLEEMLTREVSKFKMRVDASLKNDKDDKVTITELNCGKFKYADLYIELVYLYELTTK